MRVAIIHEWLVTYAGSEKVLEAMLEEFPDADVFCLVKYFSQQSLSTLNERPVRTSFLQKIPFGRHFYRYFLPLMPLAVEQFDVSGYDLIISNSHAVAKGVITGPDQLHICYCYSPMRYAWDLQAQYLAESRLERGPLSAVARMILHKMRLWDVRSASNVDHFIACSQYIARRINKAYRRPSQVIHPNVAVEDFVIGNQRCDFYATSSRMVPYKKIHLIVEAFAAMPDRRLVVIGDGPQSKRIAALATPNVTILGYQPHAVLLDHLQRARAFVFAAEEDFGIAPVEAQACGTPVIAFGRGGALETVVDGLTGIHFHEQTAESIRVAVRHFETIEDTFDETVIRAHALRFSKQRFKSELRAFVSACWLKHSDNTRRARDVHVSSDGPALGLRKLKAG